MIKYYSCTNDDIATAYPDNPNVSHNSIAGMTSCDGRHLIIMPHPERSFMDRQVPYKDVDYKKFVEKNKILYTPWYIMFNNMYDYCVNNI